MTLPRRIVGLEWAHECDRPRCIPKSRPRGTKGLGLRYERLVGKALHGMPGLRLGQWFKFCDANGGGWCQPDVLIIHPAVVFVLECKLTDVPLADMQLSGLYVPILSHVYKRPVHSIVVTKHLTRTSDLGRVCDSLASAIGRPAPVLHWLGHGPL